MQVNQLHTLKPEWDFWVWKSQDDASSWLDSLHKQITIPTIESVDYMFFKKGIKPMWEDPRNGNGGMFCIDIERQSKYTKLDRYWIELLIAIIGNQFDEYNAKINGAICNVRAKGAKICLWVSEVFPEDSPARTTIKEIIDAKLSLTTTDRLYFTKHKKL